MTKGFIVLCDAQELIMWRSPPELPMERTGGQQLEGGDRGLWAPGTQE